MGNTELSGLGQTKNNNANQLFTEYCTNSSIRAAVAQLPGMSLGQRCSPPKTKRAVLYQDDRRFFFSLSRYSVPM